MEGFNLSPKTLTNLQKAVVVLIAQPLTYQDEDSSSLGVTRPVFPNWWIISDVCQEYFTVQYLLMQPGLCIYHNIRFMEVYESIKLCTLDRLTVYTNYIQFTKLIYASICTPLSYLFGCGNEGLGGIYTTIICCWI